MNAIAASEIQVLLTRADPEALLVPSHLLRRAIKHDHRLGGLGQRVPHRHLYLIRREVLLVVASAGELGTANLPEMVLLLPRPEPSELWREGRAATLFRFWRLLFHAAVHRVFARLSPEDRRQRIEDLGDAFSEARGVLMQDHQLLALDDGTVLEEFAATFLELRAFDPERLSHTFPACDVALGEEVFGRGIDLAAMLVRCQPEGAEIIARPPSARPPDTGNDQGESPDEGGTLQRRATEEAARGNLIRAALMLMRAARTMPATRRGRLQAEARAHLARLVGRILSSMHLPEGGRTAWMDGLTALLEPASRGYWNREARLLYDIQRACTDLERPMFAADLVEPVVTLFQRAVKRPLPDVPVVMGIKYLRKAILLLPDARIDNAMRAKLSTLLHETESGLCHRLRESLRPRIAAALEESGIVATGKAEALSRAQLVEELLDRIEERGQISLPDLRDAVARSRTGLHDLTPLDLLRGDPLLRSNESLARELDGIYRRGESYLRLMQVVSSLFFGTVPGRLLTLYLLLPALAALFTVIGIDALTGEGKHLADFVSGHHHPPDPKKKHEFKMNLFDIKSEEGRLTLLWILGAAAVFYLLVIHVPRFRAGVGQAFHWLWKLLRWVIWDAPWFVIRLPSVQAILGSGPVQLFWRFIGRPMMWTVPLAIAFWLCHVPPLWVGVISGSLFTLLAVALNTRLGYLIEETAVDWMSRGWILLRDDFLLGAWAFIVWFFGLLTNLISAWMLSVDERLRFREGESSVAFASKCVLGLFWFAFAYLVRFIWLLFVEPQINPIKHFPVVTVGHKLSLLAIPVVASTGIGLGWATFILGLVPGIYGFIAWELKENWKLYRANQSPTVDPEIVGGHGEWIVNYVRPGFHSGTLPRLFARLRNTNGAAMHRAEEGLHHAEEELRRFTWRGLLVPLAASKAWGLPETPSVGEIRLATARIRIELRCDPLGAPAWVEFANVQGILEARVLDRGWMEAVSEGRQAALAELWAAYLARAGALPEPLLWKRHAEWWDADARRT